MVESTHKCFKKCFAAHPEECMNPVWKRSFLCSAPESKSKKLQSYPNSVSHGMPSTPHTMVPERCLGCLCLIVPVGPKVPLEMWCVQHKPRHSARKQRVTSLSVCTCFRVSLSLCLCVCAYSLQHRQRCTVTLSLACQA